MKNRIKLAALGLFVAFAGATCRDRAAEVAPEATSPAAPPAPDTTHAVPLPTDALPQPSAVLPPEPVLQHRFARPATPKPERPRAMAARAMAARAAKTHIVPPIGRQGAIDRTIETAPRLEPQPLPELHEAAPPLLVPPLMPPPLVLSALPARVVTPPPARASRSSGAGMQAAVMGGIGVAGVAMGFAGAEVYRQEPSGGALALTLLGAATTLIGVTFSAMLYEEDQASSPSGSARAQHPAFRVGVGPATAFAGVTY